MSYVLDFGVILLVVLYVILGYRHGFIRSAIKMGGRILAVLLAVLLSNIISSAVFDAAFAPKVESALAEELQEESQTSVAEGISAALEKLPDFISDIIVSNVGSPEEIADSLTENDQPSSSLAKTITDQYIRPLAVSILRLICFLVLLIILLIIVSVLSRLLGNVFNHLPLVKHVNAWLGAGLGLVYGVLMVFIAVTVVQFVVCLSSGGALSAETLESTFLVKHIANVNPVFESIQPILGK